MQEYLSLNFFELFDLPVSFNLDNQLLAQRYRELQSKVHPDRFANASDQEKRLSVQLAAHINEANQTLKSPQRRARYMLQMQGVKFDDEKDTSLDPEFLMHQMELRESLEAAKDISDLDTIMKTLKSNQAAILKSIAQYLQQADTDQLQQAKKEVQKLQFLAKLQQEAEALEEQLLE